jgi:hypothetical protein
LTSSIADPFSATSASHLTPTLWLFFALYGIRAGNRLVSTAPFLGTRQAAEAGPDAPLNLRLAALFNALARNYSRPGWNGCWPLHVAAELGSLPGHPARKLAAEANRSLETWLIDELESEQHPNTITAARQLLLLFNGMIITLVIHRGPVYLSNVLMAAETLVPTTN